MTTVVFGAAELQYRQCLKKHERTEQTESMNPQKTEFIVNTQIKSSISYDLCPHAVSSFHSFINIYNNHKCYD